MKQMQWCHAAAAKKGRLFLIIVSKVSCLPQSLPAVQIMTSSPWGDRQQDLSFYLWSETHKLSLTHTNPTKCTLLLLIHMNMQSHTHKAMSVWQMKEVNCLSITSWVAAGGYECTVMEGEEMNMLAISLCLWSNFPSLICTLCRISLSCNIATHLLFTSWYIYICFPILLMYSCMYFVDWLLCLCILDRYREDISTAWVFFTNLPIQTCEIWVWLEVNDQWGHQRVFENYDLC